MVCRGQGLRVVACARTVAQAVGSVTEEGASLGHAEKRERVLLAKDDGGWPGATLKEPIDFGLAHSTFGTGRVFLRILEEKLVGVRAVKVGAVLPDVSGHVVKTVGIGWVGFDRSRALKAVVACVFVGKLSGEDIGEPLFSGLEFVSPDVIESILPAPGGQFPFGLGG